MTYLSLAQYEQLLRPINPARVGTDGKGYAHVEAYEIRAHLIRIFGPARWSADVIDQKLIYEDSEQRRRKNKQGEEYGDPYTAWTVCYRSILRLTVCSPDGTPLATYTEGATGEATNQPSRGDAHELALKTSESQALKRAAFNLGDQFGLSLFNKGSRQPLVKATLNPVAGETKDGDKPNDQPPADGVDAHITEPLPPEDEQPPEPQADPRVTNRPEPPAAVPEPPEDTTDKEAQRRQAKAQEIRTQAMGEPPTEFAQPGRWHAHLMGEAMKAQVLNERVESLTSTATVSLKRFLEERMKQYVGEQRQDQANEVAS